MQLTGPLARTGSSTDVIHMAFKLLDEKGVEKYGRVNTSGETLEVRTIDPEGKIFEPLGVRRNTYNMPALAPDSVVEYRFRMETRRDPRWLDTEHFYFRDPEFENAVEGNFHLKTTSPCKNTADPAATLEVDIDGDARPLGGRHDMGADEVVE